MPGQVEKEATVEAVNGAMKKAAEGELKGILAYTEDPIVSVDMNGTSVSSTLDAAQTYVIDKTMVKVMSWYDNEWGFSHRMVELTRKMAT